MLRKRKVSKKKILRTLMLIKTLRIWSECLKDKIKFKFSLNHTCLIVNIISSLSIYILT